MLDVKYVLSDLEKVKKCMLNRNFNNLELFDEIENLYLKNKELTNQAIEIKTERRNLSKLIGKYKAQGDENKADEVMQQVKDLPEKVKKIDAEISCIQKKLNNIMMSIPNVLMDDVPIGKNEEFNTEILKKGGKPVFEFEPLNHWDIGTNLGIVDFENAAKLTGSRFVIMKNYGAKLERALINFMLDCHQESGYEEILPPFMVNSESLTGTGQLPKFEEDLFKVANTNYYLIPTAEVPLTNILRNEILSIDELPKKYVAYTPCFRSEAGSWGKDTRGLIRLHQFNKVELVKFSKPENSIAELKQLVEDACLILDKLKLHYRIVELCSGDTGFSSAKTYDLEVWMPGQNKYREISSCSCFTDFQARRANIKFKRDHKSKPEFVHTLNGSGLAIGRTLAAILENYQTEKGNVIVPEVLQSYLKTDILKK